MGAELFHVDGRTVGQKERQMDRCDEADIAFLNFANAPKMLISFSYVFVIVSEQIYGPAENPDDF